MMTQQGKKRLILTLIAQALAFVFASHISMERRSKSKDQCTVNLKHIEMGAPHASCNDNRR